MCILKFDHSVVCLFFFFFFFQAEDGIRDLVRSRGLGDVYKRQKRDVPRERWENPVFIQINKDLTAFWGILFFLGLLKSIYTFYYPDSLGIFGDAYMWISIIVGIVFTMKYPAYAKKRSQT